MVGQGAFEGCVNLGKAEVSDSVQKLGKAAFAGCKRLREVKINSDSKVKIIYPDTLGNVRIWKSYSFRRELPVSRPEHFIIMDLKIWNCRKG